MVAYSHRSSLIRSFQVKSISPQQLVLIGKPVCGCEQSLCYAFGLVHISREIALQCEK